MGLVFLLNHSVADAYTWYITNNCKQGYGFKIRIGVPTGWTGGQDIARTVDAGKTEAFHGSGLLCLREVWIQTEVGNNNTWQKLPFASGSTAYPDTFIATVCKGGNISVENDNSVKAFWATSSIFENLSFNY